jgi:hypothetical protein
VVPLLDGQLDVVLPKQLCAADDEFTLSRRSSFNSERPVAHWFRQTGAREQFEQQVSWYQKAGQPLPSDTLQGLLMLRKCRP